MAYSKFCAPDILFASQGLMNMLQIEACDAIIEVRCGDERLSVEIITKKRKKAKCYCIFRKK